MSNQFNLHVSVSTDLDVDSDIESTTLYPHRNSVFDNTNVVTKYMPMPSTSFLDIVDPKKSSSNHFSMWELLTKRNQTKGNEIGIDTTVEFTDANDGAEKLLRECTSVSKKSMTNDEFAKMTDYLSRLLAFYQDKASDSNREEVDFKYKARIVSSRGAAGQRCDRWHYDHVPLRLVASLVGPGCVYIPKENEDKHPTSLNRKALNGLDEADTKRANKMILSHGEDHVAIQARAGDAVLILGRAWEDYGINGVKAAPHKSPLLALGQLRVLLTVDVVPHVI